MKRLVRNQEVTDAEGRRRFHGAFTGGFSAGYFNSVGTKEGWTPSTFVSSRDSRSSRLQQRADDFMDEEDDPLLGKRLETTERYDTLQTGAKRRLQEAAGATGRDVIPGFALPEDWVLPVNESVGAMLLKQMGWKEGHGIGQRVRKRKFAEEEEKKESVLHDAGGEEAEEDVYVPPRKVFDVQKAFPKPKLDRGGAGFDPYTNAPEFSRYKQQLEDKQRVQQEAHRRVVSFADAMKSTVGSDSTTTGYGLSALEENDDVDVYGTVPMAEFDRVIAPLGGKSNVKRLDSSAQESRRHEKASRSRLLCSDGRPVLPGFELATAKEKPPKSVNLRLAVPTGFKAYHRFDEVEGKDDPVTVLYRKHRFSTDKNSNSKVVTAKQRGVLLGDDEEHPQDNVGSDNAATAPSSSPGSIFDLLGEEQRAKLFDAAAQAKQGLPPRMASQPAFTANNKPIVPKVRQPLVRGSGGDKFRATISASIAKRFVSSKSTAEEEKEEPHLEAQAKVSRRSQSLWIPKSLLCKRFHVKCEGPTGSNGKEDDKKHDLFDKELVPHLVEFAAGRATRRKSEEGIREVAEPASVSKTEHLDDQELPPLPAVEKASTSLLKSIFEPSDESEVSEDDSDDSDDDDGDGEVINDDEKRASASSVSIEKKEWLPDTLGAAATPAKSFQSDRRFTTSDESSSSEDEDESAHSSIPTSNGDSEQTKESKKRSHSDDGAGNHDDKQHAKEEARKHKKHKKHHKHRSSRSDKGKKRKKDKKDKKDKKEHKHRSSRHSRRSPSRSGSRKEGRSGDRYRSLSRKD